ncbi:sigma-70 family RNA polymerase sigma factor [Singulisphaera sp. PoT]|uniref:sigma-70 family RNA polymerase sigma factor n=1 Tax=Singulisphaera sp. PoT TaxID=3411797 RepID=UPI003BF58539
MAGSPFRWLFNLGAVGTMTDTQLLDRFLSGRDDASEAAFEELVSRHGPMVLRVCRNVLGDPHDAEDAFQAVFLVLASRAGSIRRRGSIANWLFGVAHRVALRARRGAARRRRLGREIAGRTPEGSPQEPDEEAPEAQALHLHEEIDGLPERLRDPVVLCYFQGLTYAAAADRLGVTEVAVRGRLARARERLRQSLTRRGVTIPAGLLVAGAAGEAQAAVPVVLVHSTVRIALGFGAGNVAAALAQGVLNAMLFHQMKVAALLLLLGIGSLSWAWLALAGPPDQRGQAGATKAIPGVAPEAKRPAVVPEPALPKVYLHPITITGRAIDPDGKPLVGAHIYLASCRGDHKRIAETVTDDEARYSFPAVGLPIERPDPNQIPKRDIGSFQIFGQADGLGFTWRPEKLFFPASRPPNREYEPGDGEDLYGPDDKIEIDLNFRRPARFSGTFVDDRGNPLAGARLEIRDCESLTTVDNVVGLSLGILNERNIAPPSMKVRTTDAEGKFAFEDMPSDCLFRIDVRAQGFPERWVYATTSPDPQPDKDGSPVYAGDFKLTFATPVDVPIQVVYADTGKPAPKVLVQAAGGLVNTAQTSDERGQVVLKIPPGEYHLQNLPERGTPYLVKDDKLVVEANPPAKPLVFNVRPAAIVEATVVDADTGAGLPDVDLCELIGDRPQREEVSFRSWEVGTRIAWVERPRTDVDGKLRTLVEPGRHRFGAGWRFLPPFYNRVDPRGKDQEVDCRAGETVKLKIALKKG